MSAAAEKLFLRIKNNPKDVRFRDLCQLAKKFGFVFKGGKGSHRVYGHTGIKEILNFQDVQGKVKPYQVKQFLCIVQRYDLKLEE